MEVKSVDGFQGREKELILFSNPNPNPNPNPSPSPNPNPNPNQELILFSAVRSNRGGSLGFVSDARRLNVLLTRARRGMIVVADPHTLVHSRRWAAWLGLGLG